MTHPFRLHAIALLALAEVCSAAPLPKSDPIQLTQQVHDIFEAKCLDCHGPELPRPKGKFGYVLDLRRVAENPDYVVRGQPQSSELYKMVFNDEMPGEDANVPALTAQEKEIVKHWIEIGAPGDLPGASLHDSAPLPEPARAKDPLWKRLLRWVGNFHPLSTHFPVAMMFVAVLAESFAWYTKRPSWLHTVRFMVVIAAVSGLAATSLGWLDAYFSSYNKAAGALLWWHRWLGTATTAWILLCAILIVFGETAEGSLGRRRFRVALLAGAAMAGISGFLGSALIYGLDHYTWR